MHTQNNGMQDINSLFPQLANNVSISTQWLSGYQEVTKHFAGKNINL